MKLRSIGLSIYGHPRELAVPFSFETRSLCNFVQRHARSLQIATTGFNQIVVQDDPFDARISAPHLVAEKTLAVPFRFEVDRYRERSSGEKQRYFVELLTTGLERAHAFHPLPLEELLGRIGEFEAQGHRNAWVHQTRTLRSLGVVAELQCELTMTEFTLTLEIRGGSAGPRRIPLLSTKPDELCFHYQFKDIVLRGDHLVITNRMHSDDELARFPLASLVTVAA